MAQVKIREKKVEGYVPRVIEIQLDTREEYDAFLTMTKTNVSVPKAVYSFDAHKREVLIKILNRVNDADWGKY